MAADRRAPEILAFDTSTVDELVDRLSEAVVERVLEVIRDEGLDHRASEDRTWLDAQEVANRLGVSREWVYEHASELGAARIGKGPRPRLRFPPRLLEVRDEEPTRERASGSTARRGRTAGLIPIRGS